MFGRRPYDEVVMRGAAFLDEMTPGWRDRVNARTLNVSSPRRCPLAQSARMCYGAATLMLGVEDADAVIFGFELDDRFGGNVVRTRRLTAAWRRYLTRSTRHQPTPTSDLAAVDAVAMTADDRTYESVGVGR